MIRRCLGFPQSNGRGIPADHVSLQFIQPNLQRSKLAVSELLVEVERREVAVALVQGPMLGTLASYEGTQDAESSKRIDVMSVYFEGDTPIGRYLDDVRYVCLKLGTYKIILRAMDVALSKRALTVETVKSVSSWDQLDEIAETYTEYNLQLCDILIPRRSSESRLKVPW
ncbi:hypothetical protein EVAR_47927_1 [Eumeta japonica]|uniref:Uncharacterized protein n=1 Tax=Eumeta variegata TaxID=151549 RepID=A0A4C1Y6J8_EUMVA|nr:hypothetical protein EVAR_47927_1 [Eumeta japonica]